MALRMPAGNLSEPYGLQGCPVPQVNLSFSFWYYRIDYAQVKFISNIFQLRVISMLPSMTLLWFTFIHQIDFNLLSL